METVLKDTNIYIYSCFVYMQVCDRPQMMQTSTLVRVPEPSGTDGLGFQFQDGSDEDQQLAPYIFSVFRPL